MSVKIEQPIYKLFGPGYHPPRPIIVDSGLESPETVTLKYEEAAARANGGDPRGDSPTGLLPMSAFKTHLTQLHGIEYGDDSFQHFHQQQQQPSRQQHLGQQDQQRQHDQQQQPDSEEPKERQDFPAPAADDEAAQLNNNPFESSSSTSPAFMTMPSTASPSLSLLSISPATGSDGTRIQLRVWSRTDVMGMSTPPPYMCVLFGAQRCLSQVTKESGGRDGYSYLVSVEAPEFAITNCLSPNNVPLTLSVELEDGGEIVRADNAGSFTYQGVQQAAMGGAVAETGTLTPDQSGMEVACDQGPHGDHTRSPPRSPARGDSPPQLTVQTSATTSPDQTHHQLPHDPATNTYDYPGVNAAAAVAAVAHAEQQVQSNYAAAAANYNQDTGMMGSYHHSAHGPQQAQHPQSQHQHRTPAFIDPYGRQGLRTPAWSSYGGNLGHDRYGTSRGPTGIGYGHTPLSRPIITPALPVPHSAPHSTTPELRRTTTMQTGSPGAGHGSGMSGGGYNPWQMIPTKAILNINGNLDSMASDWTKEEWENRRRIVLFKKKQTGNCLETTFRPVPIGERPTNSICISCIWWAEKGECYVTSVDTISLLEQLVMPGGTKFPVEEKNRIRRNLEGFKPVTVSKGKADSADFFTLIMAFGNPKPRNIEKDVKVFPWKILGQALKKIIGKYSASPSSAMSVVTPTHLLTPTSNSGAYSGLPPTPGSATTATDHTSAAGYLSMASSGRPAGTVPSPRSLPGAPNWSTSFGGGSGRPLSPGLKAVESPQVSSSLSLAGLSSVYDTRGAHTAAAISNPYALPGPTHGSHHHLGSATMSTTHSGHHDNKWDAYGLTTGASQYTSHHPTHSQMYGSGYGHGAQRA